MLSKIFSLDKIYAILAFVIILAVFVWDYASTKAELQEKKAELLILSEKVEKQNESIKQMSLDIDLYKEQKPTTVEKIVTKYNKVLVKDTTCEETLKGIYDLQKEFFTRRSE